MGKWWKCAGWQSISWLFFGERYTPTPPIISGPAAAELCRSCASPAHQLAWLLQSLAWLLYLNFNCCSQFAYHHVITQSLYLILSLIFFALSWKITHTPAPPLVRARAMAAPRFQWIIKNSSRAILPPPTHTQNFKTGSADLAIHIQVILKISVVQLKWIYMQKMLYMSLNTRVEYHSYSSCS